MCERGGDAALGQQAGVVLMTIGYQGCTADVFVEALRSAGVRTLVDVRDAPISRKEGFSKKALAATLAREGIDYVHLRGLGNPKPGRDAARAGDMAGYLQVFLTHLDCAEAQADMVRLRCLARAGGTCLMCFECDPRKCHRVIVAERAAHGADIALVHLDATAPLFAYGGDRCCHVG